MRPSLFSLVLGSLLAATPALANDAVKVEAATGAVSVRAPKTKSFTALRAGATIADGSRVRTGADGKATLRFADGSQTKVRPKSQIVVRAAPKDEQSGLVVFFGRVWTKVVKRVGGDDAFEVRSANAVAGVRGTVFEVGVADDGSTRVIVKKGRVDVGGDSADAPVQIAAGYEIESNGRGALARRRKAKRKANWGGWFAKRAKVLEKRGLEVAQDLDGRLNRRKAKVERLVKQQRQLRRDIEGLEAEKRGGANVDAQLQAKLEELESVTARLVDMKERLVAAFGLFEHWGDAAEQGMVNEPAAMKQMVENIKKVAADFADMIEEGTDLSEEGMDDMMRDMEKGGSLKPKKGGAKDELF